MALPFIMLAVLFRGIENFKMFDMVNLLTGGGPGSTTEVASITLKREAFENWRTGYSSAFAIILFVAVFGLANIYVKALEQGEAAMSLPPPIRSSSRARHVEAHRRHDRRALCADLDDPAVLDLRDQLQDAAGFDRLSAEDPVPAEHRGLLQPVHDAHAADAGIHQLAAAGDRRSATRRRASATW